MRATVRWGSDGMLVARRAGIDIAFRSVGAGPAAVLLHGTSASHAVWDPVARALAERAHVIALDQRGHGRSGKPAAGYAAGDFVTDVIGVLDAMKIDRAIVCGHSMGARNAWMTAVLHPERVAGILVVDYSPWVDRCVLDELRVRVAKGARPFDSVAEIQAYLQQRYPLLPADAVRRRARWGYGQRDDGSWVPLADAGAMDALIDGLGVPYDEEFVSVVSPMSHVRGARSLITTDAAWEAARLARPGDRWVVDPNADHYVPEENPPLLVEELTRLVTDSNLHGPGPSSPQPQGET